MNENYELIAVLAFIAVAAFVCIKKTAGEIGTKWSDPEGKKLAIKDKELHCQHCGCNNFRKLEGKINTSLVMLFQAGFWNRSAACYTCIKCGFIHWFLSPEEKVFKEIDRDEHLP